MGYRIRSYMYSNKPNIYGETNGSLHQCLKELTRLSVRNPYRVTIERQDDDNLIGLDWVVVLEYNQFGLNRPIPF